MSRHDAMWAIGGGVEHAFHSGRKVAVDIAYLQFGDGEFTIANILAVGGTISGEYDTKYGISLAVSTSW